MEEIYYSSGSAVLLLVVFILAFSLRNILKKAKWSTSHTLFDFFMGSATLFWMTFPLSDFVHRTGANSELKGLRSSLPYVGLACYALLIIGVTFLALRTATRLRRWTVFSCIALGTVVWFVVDINRDANLKWGTVAYFAPQLLMFFARERKEFPPTNVQAIAAPPTMEI